jgi:hypothetical protein
MVPGCKRRERQQRMAVQRGEGLEAISRLVVPGVDGDPGARGVPGAVGVCNSGPYSNGCFSAFFGSYANGLFDRNYEDFAVADFPGPSRLHNGFDGPLDPIVGNDNLEFNFWQKIDGVLATSVNLGVTLLASEPFHFADGHSFNANLRQGLFDVLHFEGFNDRLDFLHNLVKVRYQVQKCKEGARGEPAKRRMGAPANGGKGE